MLAVSFETLVVSLHLLIVRKELFDANIGSPTLESMQPNLDYGLQQATVEKKALLLLLLNEPP